MYPLNIQTASCRHQEAVERAWKGDTIILYSSLPTDHFSQTYDAFIAFVEMLERGSDS